MSQDAATAWAQSRFQALFEQSSAGVLVFDRQLRVTECNERVLQILGARREQLLGFDLNQVRDPTPLAAVRRALLGEAASYEGRYAATLSGETLYVSCRVTPLRDASGQVVGGMSMVEDVSERWRMDEALQASQQSAQQWDAMFRGLAEQSLTGTYVVRNGRFIYVNRRFAEMLGRRAPELVGRPALEVVAPEEHARVAEYMRQRERDDVGTHYMTVVVRPDASRVDLELYGSAFSLAGGRFLIGTALDVSERRRAEQALRASEDRYRQLVELSPEPVLVHAGGQIAFANAAASRALGLPEPEALRGRQLEELVTPELRARMGQHVERALRGDAGELEGFHFTRADGQAVELEMASVPIQYAGDAAVLSVARDVTRRRALEAELRQSQKQEAVGRLAGGIAHDFNNLLAVIISSTELSLSAVAPGSQLHADLSDTLGAAQRAAGLTQQLLAFGRRQPLRPQRVEVNAFVAEVEQLLRRVIPESVAFERELAPGPLAITADPSQLGQVLVNLSANARDAMPAGGVLRFESAALELGRDAPDRPAELPPGRYVRLTVRDTGAGMDEATRQRVFEPFFTTKALGQGTGLGLSAVYGVIRQSGGHILAESQLGRGTAFHLLFPAAPEPTRAPPHTPRPRRQLGPDAPAVLIVEDEPLMRAAIRRMLRGQGYQISEAANGVQALQVLAANPKIDVVLTDLVMPEMGGLELARQLRAVQPELKLLFMSGYSADAFQTRDVRELGAALLQKPFATAELLAHLEALTRTLERG